MGIFQLLVALIKAVPTIGKWIDELALMLFKAKASEMKQENKEAIKEALENQDQRKIENVLNSPKAATASGLDGTTIVDSLPGVQNTQQKRD